MIGMPLKGLLHAFEHYQTISLGVRRRRPSPESHSNRGCQPGPLLHCLLCVRVGKHKGKHRVFTSPEQLEEEREREQRAKEWRQKKGEESSDESGSESGSESSSSEEDAKVSAGSEVSVGSWSR